MNKLLLHYRANQRICQIGIAFIFACIVHNFPWLISWLPDDARKVIQTTVSVVINGGVGFLAFFLTKQFNTSGNGTESKPYAKPMANGGSQYIS